MGQSGKLTSNRRSLSSYSSRGADLGESVGRIRRGSLPQDVTARAQFAAYRAGWSDAFSTKTGVTNGTRGLLEQVHETFQGGFGTSEPPVRVRINRSGVCRRKAEYPSRRNTIPSLGDACDRPDQSKSTPVPRTLTFRI